METLHHHWAYIIECGVQQNIIERRASIDRSERPCLLYTSDAADDMQCVDLGGRRILRKKLIQLRRSLLNDGVVSGAVSYTHLRAHET